MPPAEEGVAAGGADAGGAVRVGEAEPRGSETVEVRGGDPGTGVVAAEVAVAEVVGVEDQHVGQPGGGGVRQRGGEGGGR